MKHSIKIATTEADGVDVTFEEQKSGLIEISFEGGTGDADGFVSRLGDALAEYKGMLADGRRRAQIKRDREKRLADLRELKKNFDEQADDSEERYTWTNANQAELDHLTELEQANEL